MVGGFFVLNFHITTQFHFGFANGKLKDYI